MPEYPITEGSIPAVISTEWRGVFFGYIPREAIGANATRTARVERARMCVYWPESARGVVGLAASGPPKGSKVGPAAPAITLHGITSVMEVSEGVAEVWERSLWT